MTRPFWLAGIAMLGWISPLPAAEPALMLDEVLESSATHFPAILQGLASRRAAEGTAMEALGAFDLVFDANGFSRLSGFYDGTAAGGTVRQRVRPLGADLYAGYKISDGTFPVYEDENFTNLGGAVRVGLMFSLLRDREIDDRRFAERDAELGLRAADLDLMLTRIGVQQRTQVSYWRWVTQVRKLRVYENLLDIARTRQTGLERQVQQGARAAIFLTENLQNIMRRESLVRTAERNVAVAANELSLFYRDGSGAPLAPGPERIPPGEEIAEISELARVNETVVPEALDKRPELALLRNAIERERNRIALAENNMKPRIDLGMEVQTGLGGVGEGGVSRDSTDTIVGFTFNVPLQRRAEKGRLARSQAELSARLEEQRLTEDRIQLEIRNVLVDLQTSRDLLLIATQEVQQAEIMRVSELRRFESGASDFFLVNVREEVAADARIKQIEAELATRLARANFDAASVDLDRLGLTGRVY
jgi:outer membrane protein TolC